MLFGTKEQESNYIDGILTMEGLEELILEGVMRGFRKLARGLNDGKMKKLKSLALRYLLDIASEDIVTIVSSLEHLEYLEIDDTHDIMGEVNEVTDALQEEFSQVVFTNLPLLNI